MANSDGIDLNELADDELADLIRDQLDEYDGLDAGEIDVLVEDGTVTVAGRVSTDAELEAIDQILADVMGIEGFVNEVVVDRLAAESGDGAARGRRPPGGRLRPRSDRTEDSAAHLLEDTGAEQFGTSDMGEAIERGYSYNPPSRRRPEPRD
jgi:hypothetical protein